jgi:MSHA biogenesis protein MshQ
MRNKYSLLKKTLVFGIIVLFAGLIIVPSISSINNQVKLKNMYTQVTPFNPFLRGWLGRKKITINHNQVAGDLNDFPVLISIVDSDLATKAQDDGDDILFMDNKGRANQMCHEIEFFDGSTGELIAWVKLPSVSSSSDTIFYMYYRNPECGSQQDVEGTWNNNYQAVYHMNDESNGILDSTAYNRDSTSYTGNPTYHQSGISGYAIDFDGGDDEFQLPHNFNLGSSDITLEIWINAASWPGYGAVCAALSFVGEHYLRCANYRNKYGEDVLRGFGYCTVSDPTWNNLVVTYNPPINTWIYIAGTYDNDVGAKAFYNAVLKATGNTNGDLLPRSSTNRIGYYFNGLIDEVRVSNIERSDAWIETTYNSIKNSSGFIISRSKEIEYNTYDNIWLLWFLERFPLLERLLTFLL